MQRPYRGNTGNIIEENKEFTAIPVEYRICNVCDLKDVENEFHFMFYCILDDDSLV